MCEPSLRKLPSHRSDRRVRVANVAIDIVSLRAAVDEIAGRASNARFAYVVTPNVDHIVRADRQREHLLPLYDEAWLSLCDSQVLRRGWRLIGVDLPLAPGSDLTKLLLEEVIEQDDAISVIGASEQTVDGMRQKFGLKRVHQYVPPMGFIADPSEVKRCIDFVVRHPARFVFLSVGSPQQEKLAFTLSHQDEGTGLGLCVGAALDFAVGTLPRAPRWMRCCGLEWLHRLS